LHGEKPSRNCSKYSASTHLVRVGLVVRSALYENQKGFAKKRNRSPSMPRQAVWQGIIAAKSRNSEDPSRPQVFLGIGSAADQHSLRPRMTEATFMLLRARFRSYKCNGRCGPVIDEAPRDRRQSSTQLLFAVSPTGSYAALDHLESFPPHDDDPSASETFLECGADRIPKNF